MSNTMLVIPEITLTKENAVRQVKLFSKKGLCYAKCYVTPEVARELLTLEKVNRNRRPALVRTYARYITTGKWKLNPDPITFDSNDTLIDGAHCLSAVVEAQRPVLFVLCCGAQPDAQKVMDQVEPRTVSDIMKIDGYQAKIYPIYPAIMRSIMTESPASLKITVPKLELADLLKQHFPAISAVALAFGFRSVCKYVRNGSVMAPITRAYEIYKGDNEKLNMIVRFIGILKGEVRNISKEEEAAYKLREWLLTSLGSGKTRPLKRVIYRKTEKALWQYLHKEKCESLHEAKQEYFPIEISKNNMAYFDNSRILFTKQGSKRSKVKRMARAK